METKEKIKDYVARMDGFKNWEHFILEKGLKNSSHLDLNVELAMDVFGEQVKIEMTEQRDQLQESVDEKVSIIAKMKQEKWIIEKMQSMCEQSLSPDTFEKWESVKEWLIKNRKI
jgi:hypothetical protein